MVTTSDIISKLIKENGYKSYRSFAIKNGFSVQTLKVSMSKNSWTPQFIEEVGKALGKDLSSLATASIGREKGFIVRK